MNNPHQYTLESALDADKNDNLFEWAQRYLRSEGHNRQLADILVKEKPTILVLKKFPLQKLKRNMGPEPEMLFFEEKEKWEKRVTSLVENIKEKSFPPLIVTDFWKPLELSDGSHRHEALLRSGIESYWTLFFFKKEESLQPLENM